MNDPKQERTVAAKLFSSIRRLPVTGPHQPTPEKLAEFASRPDPVMGDVHVFCIGCGTSLPIIHQGGEDFCRQLGLPLPTDWTGKYFLVQRCYACADDFQEPELKTVPLF